LSAPALFGYERGSPVKIALIANKGGVGKTTLCLLLHEAFRQAGHAVAVRDLDNLCERGRENRINLPI
jgi:Mrp family chromosome partitioning ATPase